MALLMNGFDVAITDDFAVSTTELSDGFADKLSFAKDWSITSIIIAFKTVSSPPPIGSSYLTLAPVTSFEFLYTQGFQLPHKPVYTIIISPLVNQVLYSRVQDH